VPQPRHPDALSDCESAAPTSQSVDDADDLMSGNDGPFFSRQIGFNDVQVRPADPATAHAQPHFTRSGPRVGKIGHSQRVRMNSPAFKENHSAHGPLLITCVQ
jgi:hypothetical protein